VLGFGAQWPEPIAILLMVIFTFVGAAAAYRAGAHIAVAMLTDRLPAALRQVCALAGGPADAGCLPVRAGLGNQAVPGDHGPDHHPLPWMPVGITYLHRCRWAGC
jgi:TRAP-type C4-dicarboxylate transport system permease small subunit